MRRLGTFPEQIWGLVERVGLGGEILEVMLPTETNARGMRAQFHAFKSSLLHERDKILPVRIKAQQQVSLTLSPGEQRVLEVAEYIDKVACVVEGCRVRFVPRQQLFSAQMFDGLRSIGKGDVTEKEEQSLAEAMKALFEEQEAGKLKRR